MLKRNRRVVSPDAVRRCRELPLPSYVVPALARFPDPYGLVEQGLRQWFEVHVRVPERPLGLPSVAVEAAWRACLDDADGYAAFCEAVYGEPLPYATDLTRTGRTWVAACAAEELDWRHPVHLPVLFLVDQTLGIPDGMRYDSRCAGRVCRVESPVVCVRHAYTEDTRWRITWFDSIDTHPR